MTARGRRGVLAGFVALQVLLLELGAVFVARHGASQGRAALFVVYVGLAALALALAAAGWVRAAAPGAGRGRALVATGIVALAWLAALRWSLDLPRPYLSLLVPVALTGTALLAVHVATGSPGPLVAGAPLLLLACLLFGTQLGDPPAAQPLVHWGQRETFRSMFPQEPPFSYPGGRLAPGLDARMHSREEPRGVRLVTNEEGFRNDASVPFLPAPGELRLLNLGDSFSIGMQIDQEEFFGARLERELAELSGARTVTVLNAEISDPAHGLYHLQSHGAEHAPRLVLLGLCSNDMLQAWQFCGPETTQRMRLDDSGRIGPNPEYRPGSFTFFERHKDLIYPRVGRRPAPGGGAASRAPSLHARLWRLRALGEDLRAFHVVRAALDMLPSQDQPRLMHSFQAKHEERDGHMRLLDGTANLGYLYRPAVPEIEALYRNLFELLAELQATARAQGARLVVVLYPQRFQVNPADWQLVVERWNLDPADFDLGQYDRRLQEACARLDVPCCNLLEAFLAADRQLYLPEGDMHPNRAGHRVAARATAEFLARAGVLPDPASLEPGSAAFELAQRIADPEPLRPWRFTATVDEATDGLAQFRRGRLDPAERELLDHLVLRGGATSPTTVVYELAGRARRLRARAWVETGKARRHLTLALRVDGRLAWSGTPGSRAEPVRLALDLQGAQRLELELAPRADPEERASVVLSGLCFERAPLDVEAPAGR